MCIMHGVWCHPPPTALAHQSGGLCNTNPPPAWQTCLPTGGRPDAARLAILPGRMHRAAQVLGVLALQVGQLLLQLGAALGVEGHLVVHIARQRQGCLAQVHICAVR